MQHKMRPALAIAILTGWLVTVTGCANQSASEPIDSLSHSNYEDRSGLVAEDSGDIKVTNDPMTDAVEEPAAEPTGNKEAQAQAEKQAKQPVEVKSEKVLLKQRDSKLLSNPQDTANASEILSDKAEDGVISLEKSDKNDAADNNILTFEELYSEVTVRGMKFSDKLLDLNDKEVVIEGYMAPPLGATVSFFVLTKIPLAICPFCSTNADWPADIVVINMRNGKSIEPTEHPLKITGKLSVGSATDDETGFVSQIRITAESVEVMK
jgi:hypothetical protein